MARASATAENAATNAVTALAAYLSVNTADPTTTGGSEATSVTRQSLTWGASSAGSAAITNAPSVPVGASQTIPYFSTWSAVTTGTYEFGGALSSSITVGATPGNITFAVGALTLGTT